MLRFSGALAPLVDARIEIDTGPIIYAEFGREHSGTLYWDAVDGLGARLQIGVDDWTATLRSISLLALPTNQVDKAAYSPPLVPTHSASPVIDMSPWSDKARRGEDWGGRYIDEEHSLRLVASETGLSLRLLPETPVSVAHMIGNVRVEVGCRSTAETHRFRAPDIR